MRNISNKCIDKIGISLMNLYNDTINKRKEYASATLSLKIRVSQIIRSVHLSVETKVLNHE